MCGLKGCGSMGKGMLCKRHVEGVGVGRDNDEETN